MNIFVSGPACPTVRSNVCGAGYAERAPLPNAQLEPANQATHAPPQPLTFLKKELQQCLNI